MSNIYKSEAIVLRRMKYSETSIIIDLLTQDHGIKSFIVNGVRSTKGKQKSAYFQYNQILDIVAYDKKTKLSRLKEYKLAHSYQSLMTDVVKSTLGVFLLEINKNVIKEQAPTPDLYRFVKTWLLELDTLPQSQLANVPSIYILELCQYLGIFPMNNQNQARLYFNKKEGLFDKYSQNTMPLESSQVLSHFINISHQEGLNMKIPKNVRNQLVDELIEYLKVQLPYDIELKSLDVLRAIF